jgi:tRNA uridine 5-carbamoylmethylation protein Kti12
MIFILTGPPAAGKSTIAPLLAQRLDRCAVIDVDQLRAMVVQPHTPPWQGEEGLTQLALGAANACILAANFNRAYFHVVILDVITNETVRIYRRQLEELDHCIFLLLPTLETVLQRNRERGQSLTDAQVQLLYEWQQRLADVDHRLDTSELTAEAVVDYLLAEGAQQVQAI